MSNELSKLSDVTKMPDAKQSDSDDSALELPQRALPQLSLQFLFAFTAVSAIAFVVVKSAVDGHPWAQIATLLFGSAIATLVAYAGAFTVGMSFNARYGNRSDNSPTGAESDAGRGSGTADRGPKTIINVIVIFSMFMASEHVSQSALADTVAFSTTYPWPKRLEYVVMAGRESTPGSGGYHTIHIKVVPTGKAFTRQHELTFAISTHHDFQRTLAATTTSKLTLEQSAGETHHQVLIPNFCAEYSFRLVIKEDGRSVLDEPWELVSNHPTILYMHQQLTMGILDPKSLGVSTPFPDVRSIVTVVGNGRGDLAPIPEDASELRLSDVDARNLVGSAQPALIQFRVLEPLPGTANWLGLSDLDVMMAAKEFWTHPAIEQSSRDAVRRWVAAGGVLWSYGDTTSTSQQQGDFLDSLKFDSVALSNVPIGKVFIDSLQLDQPNNNSPYVTNYSASVYRQQQSNSVGLRKRQEVMDALTAANNPIAKIESQQDVASRIRSAEYGLGWIVTINSPDPFPGSLQIWKACENVSIGSSVWTRWGDRFGLSYDGGSTNYWRWLIAEVGGPPVKSFLVLNTLFVLVVGPAACLVLRRYSKLYLLYFLAPTLALLVSGSLFAYAIWSDGLGTKVRSHQWTWLDRSNDVVVHQDRSTYYSALGSGQLRFPKEALVAVSTPIGNIDEYVHMGSRAYPGGSVAWTENAQVWSDDFLPSRSQVQYLATQPFIDTVSALAFDESKAGTAVVTNQFKEAVGPLIYRSLSGAFFRIDQINAGDTQPMQPSNQHAVGQLIDEHVLPPTGFVPDLGRIRYYSTSPSDKRPELEDRLDEWRSQMPKGFFCGLKEVDLSRIAIENAEVSASLQIVMGRSE